MAISVTRQWTVLPAGCANGVYQGSIFVSFAVRADAGEPESDLSKIPDVAGWQELVDGILQPGADLHLDLQVRNGATYSSLPGQGGAPAPLKIGASVTSADAHAFWNAYMTTPQKTWRTLAATVAPHPMLRLAGAASTAPFQPSLSFPGKDCVEAGRSRYLGHAATTQLLALERNALRFDAAPGPLEQARAFLEATTRSSATRSLALFASDSADNPLVSRPMTFEEALAAAGKMPQLLAHLRLCLQFELRPGAVLADGAVAVIPVQTNRPAYETDATFWTKFRSDPANNVFRTADYLASDDPLAPSDPALRLSPVIAEGWLNLRAKDAARNDVFAVEQLDPMTVALTALSAKTVLPEPRTVSSSARNIGPRDPAAPSLTLAVPEFLVTFDQTAPVRVPAQALTLPAFSTTFAAVDTTGALTILRDDASGLRHDPTGQVPDPLVVYGFEADETRVYSIRLLAPVGIDTPEITASKMHGLTSGDPMILYGERARALDQRLARAQQTISQMTDEHRLAAISTSHRALLAARPVAFDSLGPDLTLLDVTRGVALEVREKVKGQWRSLCRRHVRYAVPGTSPIDFDEDHAIDIPPVRDLSRPSGDRVGVVDQVATWPEGDSPVATRAFKGIARDGSVSTGAAPGPDGIKTTVTAIGPAPALRFGKTYQFRLPLIDHAGQRVAGGDGAGYASEEFTYYRYEPVGAPVIVLPKPLRPDAEPGEAPKTIVFRGWATKDLPSSYEPHRHILPPRCDGAYAARHGVMDGALDVDAYAWYGRNARYPDATSSDDVQYLDITDLPYDSSAKSKAALPDPMAKRYIVSDVPGMNGAPLALDLYPAGRTWPNPIPWRITLSATDDLNKAPDVTYDAAYAELRIYLKRGTEARISIACELRDDQLDLMGIWKDVSAGGSPLDPAALKAEVQRRGHWLLNPALELRLVYATVDPLFAPATTAVVDRQRVAGPRESAPPTRGLPIVAIETLDGTTVAFQLERYVPNASVDRLECRAHWFEWADHADGVAHPPQKIPRSEIVHAESLPDTGNGWRVLRFAHSFDSPRAKGIALSYAATSRFGQFVSDDPVHKTLVADDPQGVVVRNTVRPSPPRIRSADVAFEWDPPHDDTTVRSQGTRKMVVRIRLERPAYQTGLDERIAVVLADTLPDDPHADEPQLVSLAGRDPRNSAGQVPPLDASQAGIFRRNSEPPVGAVRHHQLATTVTLVPYEMAFDADADCWYVDVMLDVAAYTPFVRLALLRYQPVSLADRACSDIAMAPPVPIYPPRSASVTAAVSSGAGKSSTTVTVSAALRGDDTHVVAQLLVPRLPDSGGPDWTPWGPLVELTRAGDTFSGVVESTHDGPWRVRVTEYEISPSDGEVRTAVYFDELDVPNPVVNTLQLVERTT